MKLFVASHLRFEKIE